MENVYNINYTSHMDGQNKVNTIVWTIRSFMALLDNKSLRYLKTEKPKDSPANPHNFSFNLKMHFLGRDNELIEIYYLTPNSVFIKSILSVCLRRFEERSISIHDYHTVDGNKWQYLTSILRKDLVNFEGTDDFLLNDGSFRLKFQFIVTNDIKINRSIVPETQLSSDFKNLLKIGIYSDVIIKSVDGVEHEVHKAVLASRSIVLKAHFDHNTKECQTNIIESPFEAEILTEVLTFIYSDTAPRVKELPERLLAAADFYQLRRLKSLCEEALQKKLTVANAIETLQLADLHSANVLKQLTLEFIKDGQANLITKTESWNNITSVDLIKSIYEFILDDEIVADLK